MDRSDHKWLRLKLVGISGGEPEASPGVKRSGARWLGPLRLLNNLLGDKPAGTARSRRSKGYY